MLQISRLPATLALCLGLGFGFGFGHAALGQVVVPQPQNPVRGPVPAEAAQAEKVRLLVGLAEIERDLPLGFLGFGEGGASAALQATWPAISDGILAASGPDLGPLLAQLAGDPAAFAPVSVALAKARTALAPTASDLIAAILAQGELVAATLNPAEPTDAPAFRTAWAGLIVARGQIDLVLRDADPAVVKAATEAAVALDDLILALPDPTLPAPVALEPAAILGALKPLAGMGTV